MFNIKNCEKEILEYCAASESLSPMLMALELMERGIVRLHGPEHHFLTAAVLAAAWYNSRSEDSRPHLEKLMERCGKIAPAVCGYYGVCGDTMGAGAFLSEALDANYLSGESWAILNKFTARVQKAVGDSCERGPRCCKRTSFAAITGAVKAVRELCGAELESEEEDFFCTFCGDNPQCVGDKCVFFPGGHKV